jgi:hypothetical protein
MISGVGQEPFIQFSGGFHNLFFTELTCVCRLSPFTKKRSPQALLGDFQGCLQRDGYGVYGSLAQENAGLISVGCWAHARRKFVEALEEQNPETLFIVGELRQLYWLERHAHDEALTAEQRQQLRQKKSCQIDHGGKRAFYWCILELKVYVFVASFPV